MLINSPIRAQRNTTPPGNIDSFSCSCRGQIRLPWSWNMECGILELAWLSQCNAVGTLTLTDLYSRLDPPPLLVGASYCCCYTESQQATDLQVAAATVVHTAVEFYWYDNYFARTGPTWRVLREYEVSLRHMPTVGEWRKKELKTMQHAHESILPRNGIPACNCCTERL